MCFPIAEPSISFLVMMFLKLLQKFYLSLSFPLPHQPRGRRPVAAVARDIALAQDAGWPVHVQHISAGAAVELIRDASRHGIGITAEATPHHICLNDEAVAEYGPNARVNPPLRSEKDRQAILEGLRDGTISVIATDHAPHTAAEKAVGMTDAPSGIIGLECAVALCLTELYHGGILSLPDLVAKFTTGPRAVLGIEYGTLNQGAPADITILDVETLHLIKVSEFESRSRNCPFDGWQCRGRAVATIVGGKWVKNTTGVATC